MWEKPFSGSLPSHNSSCHWPLHLQKTGELQLLLLNFLCWQTCWREGEQCEARGKLTAVRGRTCLLQTPNSPRLLVPSFLFSLLDSSYFSMDSTRREKSATAISYLIGKTGSDFQALRDISFLPRKSFSVSLLSAML